MIVEAIILGGSSIFVSSLWFANSLLKRDDANDKEDEAYAKEGENSDDVDIHPFQRIVAGCSCAVCGQRSVAADGGSVMTHGITNVPTICKTPKECPAGSKKHLHVKCASCQSEYFMATADGKKER